MSYAAAASTDAGEPPRPGRRPWRADVLAGSALIGICAAIGIPLGWLWESISPHTQAYVASADYIVPDETESQVAADARALLLCAGLGIAIGVVAWLWRSRRGPIMALAATLAAAAAAVVLAAAGQLISGGRSSGAVNTVITLPIEVHARAVLAVAPLLTVLVYLMCALFASSDDLGRADAPPSAPAPAPAAPQPYGYPVGGYSAPPDSMSYSPDRPE